MLDKTRDRLKDQEWSFAPDPTTGRYNVDVCMLACLMDIRYELKRLNSLLHCSNFTEFPHALRRIALNTAKPRRKRK